jgi:23S rRNA (guanosine2251-2'-O)-methyltransferase
MEIVKTAKERKVMIQVVEKSRLDEIAPRHQGLIAFASAFRYSTVEDMLQKAEELGEAPFLILLDGITDPHNLGAIIRTAECTGVHGIIIPQHRSVGLTPSAVKSSAGAVEYVKVARVNNLSRTIEYLQQKNIWMYAVTMNGNDYREISFKGGVALVIGAEEDGISRLVAEKCDYAVSLPMTGKIESLNASVAAGIMMYRVLECRK